MDEDLRLAAIEASKLFKKGKYEEAVDICTLGISDYPQYSSLYLILAKFYIALGDVSEAHKVFESASKFFVNDPLINTLKDILELTPNDAISVDKKKSKPVIEETSQKAEPSLMQTDEVEVFSQVTEENIEFKIQESIDEAISNESNFITNDDELVIEQYQEQNISTESTEILASEDWEIEHEEIEQIDIATEFVTPADEFEDVMLHEQIHELDDAIDEEVIEVISETEEVNEVIIYEIQSLEEITSFDDEVESESDYDSLLNEFDSMVSSVEVAIDYNDDNDDEDEYYDFSASEEIESEVEDVEIERSPHTNFVFPISQHTASNFIAKAKQGSVNEESLFYVDSVAQAQKVIPHFEDFIHSEQKSHHIEDVNFTLENPLKSEFFTSISDLVTEPLEFQETYQSDRSKHSETIDFEQEIENLNIAKALFQPIVHK
jgi:tetratricopeptide (TPR) repeat protein